MLWFVLILTVKKRWLALCNRNLHDCIYVSIPAPLRFGRIFNRETRQPWGEYGMEIPVSFPFYGPEKIIKLAKDQITKIEESLRKTVRQCLT